MSKFRLEIETLENGEKRYYPQQKVILGWFYIVETEEDKLELKNAPLTWNDTREEALAMIEKFKTLSAKHSHKKMKYERV